MKHEIEILIQEKIHEIRGVKVILDEDLAAIYGIETKVLNQALNRNSRRFPPEFMFKLTETEWKSLRSQFVTLKTSRGKHRKFAPNVFSEYGVVMLASILNSERAIKMNIAIVKAFIALRQLQYEQSELGDRINELEKKYDKRFFNIEQALDFILQQNEPKISERKRIGFKSERIK